MDIFKEDLIKLVKKHEIVISSWDNKLFFENIKGSYIVDGSGCTFYLVDLEAGETF